MFALLIVHKTVRYKRWAHNRTIMIPFSTFTERLNAIMRMLPAYVIVAVLFVIGIVSVSYPLNGILETPFFLMALYYWSIYRPTLLPRWLVFVIGCLMDFLVGFPVGMSAVLFLIVQWFVGSQRKFLMAQSFLFVWFGFFVVSVSVLAAQWSIFSVVAGHAYPLKPLLVSAFLGGVLFPFVALLLHFTHKFLPVRAFQLRMRG